MQDENHIVLELKLRKSGRVDMVAEADLGNTWRLQQVLDGLGLKDEPGWFEQRIHAMEKKFDALEQARQPPAEQPDDEALVEEMYRVWEEAPGGSVKSMLSVLAHLRAKGLMRTADDAGLERQRAHEEQRAIGLQDKLDKAQAQVRELTAKAAEANAKVDATHKEMGLLLRKCATLEGVRQEDIATRVAAEKRAHEAGQEAVRIGTELLEAKKALQWEREALKAAQRRLEALESGGRGSDTQAKAAQDG